MVALADELRDLFQKRKVSALGDLLHKGWLYKKELATGISNERIETLYSKALENGAEGGKLLGAGGDGFLLICAKNHEILRKAMGCRVLQFKLDRDGTKIIFYE